MITPHESLIEKYTAQPFYANMRNAAAAYGMSHHKEI
jgi:hypothetical protein